MTKIGLALGSGGLRGMAHLGVLQVLEEENIPIDYVAGCSIGSVVGALYCSGQPMDMLIKLAKEIKTRHVLDFSVPKMGIFSGDKILELMNLLTKQCDFEQLKTPLNIVATDLHKGESVVLKSGLVSKAVRASISVPGIFVPYELNGAVLVDGAVLNPTPADIAFSMGADVVIAVDLSQALTNFPLNNMFDIIIKSIDIMENELIKNKQADSNVILLRPNVAHIPPSSFAHIEESIALGRKSAQEMLPELYRLLNA